MISDQPVYAEIIKEEGMDENTTLNNDYLQFLENNRELLATVDKHLMALVWDQFHAPWPRSMMLMEIPYEFEMLQRHYLRRYIQSALTMERIKNSFKDIEYEEFRIDLQQGVESYSYSGKKQYMEISARVRRLNCSCVIS